MNTIRTRRLVRARGKNRGLGNDPLVDQHIGAPGLLDSAIALPAVGIILKYRFFATVTLVHYALWIEGREGIGTR